MTDLRTIPLRTITGAPATLSDYAGKVLLVVNVASKCGLTPQYQGLETLYQTHRDRGFAVLAFPANDFAGQEPGTEAEIASFCETSYGVTFPMFAKIGVTGPAKHPLYEALTQAQPHASVTTPDGGMREKLRGYGMSPNPEPEVLWNFEKFVVSRTGEVIARFAPDTEPTDPELLKVIEENL